MGNGLSASLGKRRLIDRSIAHNGGAARANSGRSLRAGAFSGANRRLGLREIYAARKEILRRAETSSGEQASSRTQIIRL
jgi:hypothetical protein